MKNRVEEEAAVEKSTAIEGIDLTVGSIPRHLLNFSIPMLIGGALQTAYSIVNAIWVGNGLGTNDMAAVTVSQPIFFALMAVAFGLTLASTILVSQSYGAKDIQGVKRVVQNSIILSVVVSIICITVGLIFAEPVLRAMDTPKASLTLSINYLRLFLWTIPPTFGIFLIASVLRGIGDSKTPLYFQGASVILAAILDPILMFGWLGLPRMGLNGTAVSTIISMSLTVIALHIYLQRIGHVVAPDLRHLKADWPTSWITLKIGIPTMFQQGFVSLGAIFMVGLVNHFGTDGSAAFGAAMRIDQLAFIPAMTVGMAVSTLAGQNIGAKRLDRVKSVLKWGVLFSASMTAVATLLAVSIPGLLMRMFARDPQVIHIGISYLRIVGFGYLFFSIMFTSNGVINGSGHTMATTFFTLFSFWIVRIPLAAFLSHRMGSITGIWIGMLISFAAGAFVSIIYYFSGRWKKPIRRKIIPPESSSQLSMDSE